MTKEIDEVQDYHITEDGLLAEVEDSEDADFEEDLTFNE